MIPCKENKCILLAVCKHKKEIDCTILREWMDQAITPWKRIDETFKDVVSVDYDDVQTVTNVKKTHRLIGRLRGRR